MSDWRTICLINKNHETMDKDGTAVPVWIVAGKEKDGTHHVLRIHGERVRPSFGVPYEEFWKVMDDPRITGFHRGPDSPFGEPVMEVYSKLPKDVGTGQSAIRNFVSHSYQGDIRFEDKVGIDLLIWEGYMMFDFSMVEQYGYLDDKFVQPPPEGYEKFYVNKHKVYFDSEWTMKALIDDVGRLRFRQRLKKKEDEEERYVKSKVITISFLQSWDWTFHVFTWHPRVKEKCTYQERYISRISEDARQKIKVMPMEFHVEVHACENEKQLLTGMVDYLSGTQIDALIGFNAFSGIHGLGDSKKWQNGFDMPWLYRHCMVKPNKDYQTWVPRDPDVNLHRISPAGVTYFRDDFGKEEVVIKMLTCLDLYHMMAFFEYHKKDKLKNEKLDTYMDRYLGIGKVKHPQYRWVWDMWEKEPPLERLYNMGDTEGTAGVEQIFKPSEDAFNRATFSGASWDAGMAASRLHDLVNLHLYKDLYYLDTKTYGDNKYERIWLWNGFTDEKVGGFNKEVNRGMKRLVFGMDFNKFYPMAGIGSNCAPETFVNMAGLRLTGKGLMVVDRRPCLIKEVEDWPEFVKECKREQAAMGDDVSMALKSLQSIISNKLIGWKETLYNWSDLAITPAGIFRKDIIARNVLAFKAMLVERKKLQKVADAILEKVKDMDDFDYVVADGRQFSYKQYMNGRFGTQGMDWDRMYFLPLFNTYTLVCQEIIKECIDYVENVLGYPVDLASTDSMYAEHKRPIEWIWKEIVNKDGTVKKLCYSKEAEEVVEKVQAHAQEFAKREFNIDDPGVFTLECDMICKTMFIENMRFYIKNVMWAKGKLIDPPQLEFKGMKVVRREVAAVTEEVQERLGKLYMNDGTADDIMVEVMKLHEEFIAMPLTEVCKTLPVNKPYRDYDEKSEQYKAFALADEFFDVDIAVGDRFFIAPLKYCPKMIHGKKVPDNLGDKVAFDEDSIQRMLDAGVQVDMHELEDSGVASPADEILEVFGTSYWKQVNKSRTANTHGDF